MELEQDPAERRNESATAMEILVLHKARIAQEFLRLAQRELRKSSAWRNADFGRVAEQRPLQTDARHATTDMKVTHFWMRSLTITSSVLVNSPVDLLNSVHQAFTLSLKGT